MIEKKLKRSVAEIKLRGGFSNLCPVIRNRALYFTVEAEILRL
jgi:hypothetical protein